MLEVNANAKFARTHKLRASGDGQLQVDGPAGFKLVIQAIGGAPVGYSRPGSPVTGTLRRGEQITVTGRTTFVTLGEVSVLAVVPGEATTASHPQPATPTQPAKPSKVGTLRKSRGEKAA